MERNWNQTQEDRFARLPYGLFQINFHILRGGGEKKINKRFNFPKWER